MSSFSYLPLQQAVYQALSGDSALSALISGVFDHPPQGTVFPYVTLGESEISDWSTKTTAGTQQLLSLHVWSREGGHAETATIMQRIYQLLHQASLTVTNQALISLRFVSSKVALEDDG